MSTELPAGGPTRRIVANFFLTLDGVMESPEKWQFAYFNEEMVRPSGPVSPPAMPC